MSAISIPAASACISVLFLLGTLPAQTTDEAGPPSDVSKVRIVRLSEVKGAVQLDRNTGRGYETVLANLPIVEHSRLQTGMGVAEVEFEDNSTLRIAPGSIVVFTQLDRLPGGATVSSVRLVEGMAYVSLLKTRGNEFNVLFGQQKLQLPPSSHIRLQVHGPQATLAVLDGALHIDGPAGPTDVSRKKTVTFQLQDQEAQLTVAKDVVPEALDAWDKDAAARHAQSVTTTAFASPYSYGLADMMYYGSFTSVGGCGSIWRPYFASAAWDPYSNGAWAWYQGAGYSWVSPYPWGWTPFHFGSWSYCSGAGWGWRPGGSWNGLNNATAMVPGGGAALVASGGSPVRPPRPVRPPGPGEPTLTQMNLKPLVRSQAVSADSFVFRKDSAGLGIPREGMGKLEKLSQSAISRGATTTPIYLSTPSSAPGNGRPANESMAVTSLHRGSAPTPVASTPSQPSSSGRGGGSSAGSSQQPGSQATRSVPQPSSQPAPAAVPAPGHPH
jgi:hypothetical protein